MFGKKKIKAAQIDTLIGKHTVVKGDIHYRGGLHIEGKVQGNIIAESHEKTVLIVSEKGCVEGDVKGPVVILNGMIEGDVHSSATLELAQHAKVKGNVYYKLLEMEVGAEVNGSLIHQSTATANDQDKSTLNRVPEGDKSQARQVSDEASLTTGK